MIGFFYLRTDGNPAIVIEQTGFPERLNDRSKGCRIERDPGLVQRVKTAPLGSIVLDNFFDAVVEETVLKNHLMAATPRTRQAIYREGITQPKKPPCKLLRCDLQLG
jgi:hypothetical protein